MRKNIGLLLAAAAASFVPGALHSRVPSLSPPRFVTPWLPPVPRRMQPGKSTNGRGRSITVAHAKRLARKRRNRLRHKAHVRGGKP